MEIKNAFVGQPTRPLPNEVAKALGPSFVPWKALTEWLTGKGITCDGWQSISPKYGWSLRPILKARTILYMSPSDGCFRVSFALGDKAVAAARKSDLPKPLLLEIAKARRYAEGTAVRVIVRSGENLEAVKKLVEIKLEN